MAARLGEALPPEKPIGIGVVLPPSQARATPFDVQIYPHLSVGDHLSSLSDQLSYAPVSIQPPGKDLPLKFYQAHPVIGKKILCFFFEPGPDGTSLSFVLTGTADG